MGLTLNWIKCQGDVWCKLNAVNLDHQHFISKQGVYLIWHGGSSPHVVYVGQGVIRDRIRAHRNDARVQQYSNSDLFVTWATVEPHLRNGVEAYLASVWNPWVGVEHPNAPHVEVNPPWQDG